MPLSKPRERQSPGLLAKLALFFLSLSLPALLLVELTVVVFEYSGLIHRIDSGLLRHALEIESPRIAAILVNERRITVEHALGAWLLRLERPRSLLGDETAYVLLELARQPFSAAVIDRSGKLVAIAPEMESTWQLDVAAFAREVDADLPSQELLRLESDTFTRRFAAPLWYARELRGWLLLEIRLNKPWSKLASDVSFEWPVVLASLLLIAFGAALFLRWTVTRRLNRIHTAAGSWARGDFTTLVNDRSTDELGSLSGELDRMALSLRELLHARGALARMAERERLARDLHDTVKQQAFALHLKLAAVLKRMHDSTPFRPELEQARALVHSIQTELAQILVGLKTDSGPALPLVERLRAQLDAWSQISTIPSKLRAMVDVDLPPPLQDELLRLVDEALANVLKHSQAHQVDVLLQRRGTRALLRLADDGCGLPENRRNDGMGMDNMRSRAAQLPAGQWRIMAGPAGGTVVEVSWSVQTDAPR